MPSHRFSENAGTPPEVALSRLPSLARIFATMPVTKIHARQIIDSRGNPTVEAEIHTDKGEARPVNAPLGSRRVMPARIAAAARPNPFERVDCLNYDTNGPLTRGC